MARWEAQMLPLGYAVPLRGLGVDSSSASGHFNSLQPAIIICLLRHTQEYPHHLRCAARGIARLNKTKHGNISKSLLMTGV